MENSKKKILYVITKSNWGGAGKYVVELATHMHRLGSYDVAVACGPNEFGGKNIFKEKLGQAGVRIVDMQHSGRNISLLKDVLTFWDLLKTFISERPDIVHLNSSKVAGVGAFAARITGISKIVYTVHGLPFLEDRPWWQNKIIAMLTYVTFILSHKMIVLSKQEYERVGDWLGTKKKLTLVPIGIHPTSFMSQEDARRELAARYHISFDERIVIGSIAELTKNKGQIYLLEALKLLKQDGHRFMFVNFGEGDLRDKLEARVRKLGLEECVFLPGFVENGKAYLKAFDIFVLSSVKEGLPYTILEAGFAKLPVVATKVGGVPEVVTDDTQGTIIPPKDPQALADALKKLLANVSLRSTHGAALHQRVSEKFSFDAMVTATVSVYGQTS